MLGQLFLHATVCKWRLHLEDHMLVALPRLRAWVVALVRLVEHMELFQVRPLPDLVADVVEESPKLLFRKVGWNEPLLLPPRRG